MCRIRSWIRICSLIRIRSKMSRIPQHTGCVPDLVFSSMRARVRFSRGRLFLAAAVVAAAAPLVAAPVVAAPLVAAPVVAAPVVAASKWPADFVLRWSTVPSSTKEIRSWKQCYGFGMFMVSRIRIFSIQDPGTSVKKIPDTHQRI
jgi:hypothetical protein